MSLPPEYDVIATADRSLTLAYRRGDGYAEMMHHLRGALAESVFIYADALERALDMVPRVRVMSIGLGLGYNELLTIAALERRNTSGHVTSYESSAYLRAQFEAWLAGNHLGPLAPVYDDVAARVDVDPAIVTRWWREGRLDLRGAFPAAVPPDQSINLVYFDAYSNKMDAGLWNEDALVAALEPALAPTCVLASYARTGTLNRVLRRLGFEFVVKRGFYMKRSSTLAIRGPQAASRSEVDSASTAGSSSAD